MHDVAKEKPMRTRSRAEKHPAPLQDLFGPLLLDVESPRRKPLHGAKLEAGC